MSGKEVTATDDSLYQTYVDNAVQMTAELSKNIETNTLTWYWKIGDLFSEFTVQVKAKKLVGRTVAHLAADIRTGSGYEVSEPVLYCARQIHERYGLNNLPKLVQQGVTVGHLKLIMPLDGEVKKMVENLMMGADGKVISIVALAKIIEEHKKLAVTQQTEQARVEADKPRAAPEIDYTDPDASMADLEEQQDAAEGSDQEEPAAETDKKPDDGKTGSRGMVDQKEFTVNPLQALKALDKAATAVIGKAADAITALAEAVKVGYDSDKARKNFLEQVTNVEASLVGVQNLIPDMLERIQETKKNV